MDNPQRDLALSYLSHVERGDFAAATSLFALDAEVHMPGHPTFGVTELSEFLALTFEQLAERSFVLKPIGTTVEGERVAIEAHSAATRRDGARYENRYHFLFIVREGKIRSLAVYTASDLALSAAWTSTRPKRASVRHLRSVRG